jgi:hypothetical protein
MKRLQAPGRAIQVVQEALYEYGFVWEHRIKKDDLIHIVWDRLRQKPCDGWVELQHRKQVDSQRRFPARAVPPRTDGRYFVVLVDLRQYFLPGFYVLTGEEAVARWVLNEAPVNGGPFKDCAYLYDAHGLRPNRDTFKKLEVLSGGQS